MKGISPKKKRWLSPKTGGSLNHGSTARRAHLGDLCAVLLFLLLLPYVCSLLLGKEREAASGRILPAGEEAVVVICREEAGARILPLETYVTGALAASIPISSGEETLKAQAVILRTLCMWERENSGDGKIDAKKLGQEYLEMEELQELWGADFEENREKLEQAVSATKGIYMTYEGKPMEPAYFWLSAGSTREGGEVLGEGYDYLARVDCSHDMEADEYISSLSMEEEAFWELLGIPKQSRLALTRDSAGYVLWMEAGEERIPGERVRSLLGLASSCFDMTSENGRVEFTCKGVGHGLGFCQHEADRRAGKGEDYLTLLKAFFRDVEMEKIAE